jgi:endonuclease-3
MPRESRQQLLERWNQIRTTLRSTYPNAHCELTHSNPLELLIATILSAQCSDAQVNRVTPNLFRKYPSALHYAQASLPQLESDLKQIGLFRSKARNIKSCAQSLVDQHQGHVPNSMDQLIRLAGVGRKTANVVLGNAFNQIEGIVVDTHVARLSTRFSLTRAKHPEKIEADLTKITPREDWTLISHLLIFHGRRRCNARRPDCASCEVKTWCPSALPQN